MRTSTDHILTSHVGSLPRPDELIAANRARETGAAVNPGDQRDFEKTLGAAVIEAVRHQHELGNDVPSDGEFWHFLRQNQLSNRLFDTYEAILDACCDAWNAFVATPERVRSVTERPWAQVII